MFYQPTGNITQHFILRLRFQHGIISDVETVVMRSEQFRIAAMIFMIPAHVCDDLNLSSPGSIAMEVDVDVDEDIPHPGDKESGKGERESSKSSEKLIIKKNKSHLSGKEETEI